jgi:hypothetical protein
MSNSPSDVLSKATKSAMEKAAATSGHAAGSYAIAAEAIDAFLSEIGKELVLVPREMPTTFEEVLPQEIAAQLAMNPNAPEEVITELQDRFNEALGKAVASLAAPGAAGEEGKEG